MPRLHSRSSASAVGGVRNHLWTSGTGGHGSARERAVRRKNEGNRLVEASLAAHGRLFRRHLLAQEPRVVAAPRRAVRGAPPVPDAVAGDGQACLRPVLPQQIGPERDRAAGWVRDDARADEFFPLGVRGARAPVCRDALRSHLCRHEHNGRRARAEKFVGGALKEAAAVRRGANAVPAGRSSIRAPLEHQHDFVDVGIIFSAAERVL